MRLIFHNADTIPKCQVLEVCGDTQTVTLIMQWYAGFHSGVRYAVTLDGRNVPFDNLGMPYLEDGKVFTT